MIIFSILVFALWVIFVAAAICSGNKDDFETKYSEHDIKVINPDKQCWNCASFYDGKIDAYPFVSVDERPHPPCCVNRKRCLKDKSKCYVRDTL